MADIKVSMLNPETPRGNLEKLIESRQRKVARVWGPNLGVKDSCPRVRANESESRKYDNCNFGWKH